MAKKKLTTAEIEAQIEALKNREVELQDDVKRITGQIADAMLAGDDTAELQRQAGIANGELMMIPTIVERLQEGLLAARKAAIQVKFAASLETLKKHRQDYKKAKTAADKIRAELEPLEADEKRLNQSYMSTVNHVAGFEDELVSKHGFSRDEIVKIKAEHGS